VIWLPDRTVDHLKAVAAWPEFTSDRYDVLEEIGRGGMGRVYSALDTALGREVAIKVGNDLTSPERHARLEREAQVLARLEHPGIVPVHDVGLLADGRPFYVMKRVQGRTLQACLDPMPPLTERLRMFERVCEAVSFAHAQGIIHRDLKPDNVMVGPFGEVMVTDWGVARVLGGEASAPVGAGGSAIAPGGSRRTTGVVMGTPGFMPPEQASHSGDVDERADVYALGAVLFTLLTGQLPPADGVTDRRLQRSRAIPAPLLSICRAAMAAAPDDRYPTVAALAGDVSRFRERQAVSVHPERSVERLARVVRTYQAPILLVLAYIVMRGLIAFFAGL
jgi:eukaryotic-like serine/threonine-protein kinase